MKIVAAIKERRSVYELSDRGSGMDREIIEIVETALSYSPSAYNSRSARILLLFGSEHRIYWDLVAAALKKKLSADSLKRALERIEGFSKARGTVLFFEDHDTVEEISSRFPSNKDSFPNWSLQSSGMLQFAVWTALADRGIGASLQHYGELVAEEIRETWHTGESWKPIAQMPFGTIEAIPEPRELTDLKQAFIVAGL